MIKTTRTRFILVLCAVILLVALWLLGANAGNAILVTQETVKDSHDQEREQKAEQINEMQISIEMVTSSDEQDADNNTDSKFPPVWVSYRESIGFQTYFHEMKKHGAVFFFYSPKHNKWVELTEHRNVIPFDINRIGREFSDTPNVLKNEPALGNIVTSVQAAENIVYVGRTLRGTNTFQNNLSQRLSERGHDVRSITGIKGIYVTKNGALYLSVRSIAVEKIGEIKVSFEVEVN